MNKLCVFDRVIEYIEENCMLEYSEIKKGISRITNRSITEISNLITIITNETVSLNEYYLRRKLYHAAKELIENDKQISELANEYGYFDQAAFSKAIKRQYNMTPKELKEKKPIIPNEKLAFKDFISDKDVIGKRLIDSFESVVGENSFNTDEDYFFTYLNANNEYGFDYSTCLVISELSERLKVPFREMIEICFDAMVDSQERRDIPYELEIAWDLDLSSTDELRKICEYYKCEYYQLNKRLIELYYEKQAEING